jgi:hypothetical protein
MQLPILLTYNSENTIENDTKWKEEDNTDGVEFITAPAIHWNINIGESNQPFTGN